MPRDYFSILGLTPGRCEPAEVTRRFEQRRAGLLSNGNRLSRDELAERLDALHAAHRMLSDRDRQQDYLREIENGDSRTARLSRLIEASLEGDLLRRSRREEILAEGRRLGFSDFHTQLLIAQVQFGRGPEVIAAPSSRSGGHPFGDARRIGARLAAAALLGLGLFLGALRWIGV